MSAPRRLGRAERLRELPAIVCGCQCISCSAYESSKRSKADSGRARGQGKTGGDSSMASVFPIEDCCEQARPAECDKGRLIGAALCFQIFGTTSLQSPS